MANALLMGAAIGAFFGFALWRGQGAVIAAVIGAVFGSVVGAAIAARKTAPKPPRESADLAQSAALIAQAQRLNSAANVTLAQRVSHLEQYLAALEPRLARIEQALRVDVAPIEAPGDATAAASATSASKLDVTPQPLPAFAQPAFAPAASTLETPAAARASTPGEPSAAIPSYYTNSTLDTETAAGATDASTPPPVPRQAPIQPPSPPSRIWAWIIGGNPFARIGVVLLFIGVASAIKYTVEQVYIPISVRLAAIALGGVVMLVFGWRLRNSRTAYAMALQGGGVGVLYLTVFGALRLYSMIPPLAAFALLFWISAASSWLAIRQDAVALAVLSLAGGFLAPILTSSNTGNHVMLFAYYALLNAGVFGIAWFKAWRSLNLLGFAFTFIIGTLWGVTKYRPEHFATTEPFLVLFFLFYVGIAVLYALRRSVEVKSYVDGALVFGTPLVAAGLQSALVHDIEYAMAWSALAMSAVYLALTRALWAKHGEGLRLLVETFLALGVLFATLAIPLGLDARWTSAAWALEGAAAVWVGLRQQRRAVRAFGLVLQLAAGIAFLHGISLWRWTSIPARFPILNSSYMGSVFVSFAGLYTAWLYQQRRSDATEPERFITPIVFAWGVLWWLFAGWREISQWIAPDVQLAAMIGLLALTAAVFAVLERRLLWPIARVPALALLPILLVIAAEAIMHGVRVRHLFAHWGWIAWPLAVATVVWTLWRFDHEEKPESDSATILRLDRLHAGLLWLVLLVIAHELAWLGRQIGYADGAWAVVPWGLVPALGLAIVCALAERPNWPIGVHRDAYLLPGSIGIVGVLILWTLVANVSGDGNPAPLPYIPILNPLDITQAVAFVAVATWMVQLRRDPPEFVAKLLPRAIAMVFAALAFYWINLTVLRTIHFWFGVPFTPYGLWHSTLVQAALSLLWSAIALATMVFANRRKMRAPWIAGAALLGIVIAKLFVVELSQVGTIARIVSFIGVGLLVLAIGYLAPVPQRREGVASFAR